MPLDPRLKGAAPKGNPIGRFAPPAARALFSPQPVTPNVVPGSSGLTPAMAPSAPADPAQADDGDEGSEQADTSAPEAPGGPAPVAPVNQAPVLPAASRPQTPTTSAAPQSESSNPLTGSTNSVPAGQSTPINLPHSAGEGDMQRSFSNPTSAQLYGSYVKNLFGTKGAKPLTGLRRTSAVY